MTPEQERAEVKIDKTKIVAWLKRMIEGNEFAEADGESSAYKFTLGRIEDGKFDSNSLDREEQLIAENAKLKHRDKVVSLANETLGRYVREGSEENDLLKAKVAEQDKEIQRLSELLFTRNHGEIIPNEVEAEG